MKIEIVGDIHQRFELPYASAIKDGRRSEWKEIKEKIIETAKICDAVVLLGDFYNARHNHSTVVKESIDLLNALGNKEIHIISGNHCRYGESTALDFIQNLQHPNWFVYTRPQLTVIGKTPAMMIPFITPALLGVETKEEGIKTLIDMFLEESTPLAFIHQGISGSSINSIPVDFFEEIVLPQKEISEHFAYVFAGHVHGKQFLPPNIQITGSIFTANMGEQEKSIWVYDTDTNKTEEVKLPVRGLYKVEWENEQQFQKYGIPDNSIIKCIVTDRSVSLDFVKKTLSRFDASLIIEQYPDERQKIHFEEGTLDLSVDNLLKLYADAKKINYSDLREGFNLIKT